MYIYISAVTYMLKLMTHVSQKLRISGIFSCSEMSTEDTSLLGLIVRKLMRSIHISISTEDKKREKQN